VISLREGGSSWTDAIGWIDVAFQQHSFVHTLNNAAVIAASLLWSEDDAVRAMGSAVQAGYDTDSAAATIGSVMGVLHGRSAFPAHLTEPLSDHVHSALAGFDGVKISALAERTHALAVT
jgi:ADP-ribosylglycohydrolase